MPKETPDLFAMLSPENDPRHIFTVSEITEGIKLILEDNFAQVWVEGEISNFKAATSGHFYFSLKDKNAMLAGAMFARANKELKFKLEDGLSVICFGKIDVYAPRGQYQLIVEKIEPKGIGAQQLAFEQLKNKLFKEGLFDPAHKRPLPFMPFCIGLVTSSAGAAVRDILQILKKGAPCIDIVIRSVRVQGEQAHGEIAAAIEDLNRFNGIDLIIVSRGGGSIEDLWAFNEEIVARAVYNSRIPVISAVGHQINTTLSDLAADVFVETPSAAAKILVDKKNALLAELDGARHELGFSISQTLGQLKHNLIALSHMLKSPLDRLLEKQQQLDEILGSLNNNIQHVLSILGERMSSLTEHLGALNPLSVLARGYSLSMLMPKDILVQDASKLKPGDKIKTILANGAFISQVQEVLQDEGKGIV